MKIDLLIYNKIIIKEEKTIEQLIQFYKESNFC